MGFNISVGQRSSEILQFKEIKCEIKGCGFNIKLVTGKINTRRYKIYLHLMHEHFKQKFQEIIFIK